MALLCPLGYAPLAEAQEAWEYLPYQVRVWIALEPSPQLTARLQQQIIRTVADQADIADGAAWRVQVAPAPKWLQSQMVRDLDQVAIQPEAEDSDAMLQGDKLILVSVTVTAAGYRIRARQLDCRLRTWGPRIDRTTWQIDALPRGVFAAVEACFVPMVRIEKIKGKLVQTRLRAGGLVHSPESPAWIPDQAILQPVVRRNDRLGKLREGGIEVVPWTFLTVDGRERSKLRCTMHSGMRAPISRRSSQRIEKVAFLAKPEGPATRLVLRSNDETARALTGYQIYSRRLDAQRSAFLGVTDWQGSVQVSQPPEWAPGDAPQLRILYVKSGTRLLARLPLVPGLAPQLTARLPDDDIRLGAESVITGLQNRFMDLVARRQVLAARIRARIEKGEFQAAKKMIDQLRQLDDRPKFADRLDEQERLLVTDDQRVQKKIDLLFSDLRRLLGSHLDPQLPNQLSRELTAARQRHK